VWGGFNSLEINEMKLDKLTSILKSPYSEVDDSLEKVEGGFKCKKTGNFFSIKNGMIDFINDRSQENKKSTGKVGLMFRFNRWYNRSFEQKIASSLFSGG
jgi:hypothetical protein